MGPLPGEGRRSLLRDADGGPAAVSFLELFFDLVYVFALTQISHLILETMSWPGLAEAAVAFAAVWWAWMYTAWATNWLDPRRTPVRIVLLLVMLLSMVMSSAIPAAFGPYGIAFALAYVTIQVGRTAYTAWGREGLIHGESSNLARATLYFIASAALPSTRATTVAPDSLSFVKLAVSSPRAVWLRARSPRLAATKRRRFGF